MTPPSSPRRGRLVSAVTSRHFWILFVMLAALALLHYLTPQERFFPLPFGFLERHAVERIMFLLPVVGATFAFGQTGGVITLALVALIMLPRVFLISPQIADALLETLAVVLVGYFMVWIIEMQEREKRLRQAAVSQLRTINAVGAIVTQSLELSDILHSALSKVLEVTQVQMGFIFLLDRETQELVLTVHHGLSDEFAREIARLKLGQSLTGRVALSGVLKVAENLLHEKHLTSSLASKAGMRSFVAVPLKSRDRVLGVMDLADPAYDRFGAQEVQLLRAVGNEIGVAIENAYLYENMRFYVRQTTRAQEAERQRVARELHDDTVQSLVVLSRRLDALTGSSAEISPTCSEQLVALRDMTDEIIQGVRRFSQDLRPSILDDLGLLPALEWLADASARRDGVKTVVHVLGEKQRLSTEAELALFRIAQEALSNVKKHATAAQAVITVEFTGNDVRMTVADDGRGFLPPAQADGLAASGKLGLIGMQERARLLGGSLVLESEPGRGTRIIATMPV